jgi:hypothetical protein
VVRVAPRPLPKGDALPLLSAHHLRLRRLVLIRAFVAQLRVAIGIGPRKAALVDFQRVAVLVGAKRQRYRVDRGTVRQFRDRRRRSAIVCQAVRDRACVFAGSFLRPLGGFLAGRLGGTRVLCALFVFVIVLLLTLSTLPPLPIALGVLFIIMGCLGTVKGSVFQLVPQRFANEIGVATGVIGAAGGIGVFFLPTLLGGLKGLQGSYASGLTLFALAAAGAMVALVRVRREWRRGWAKAELGVAC